MKILVLSDSHSTLRIMRSAVEAIKPNVIVHLGDYYDDGEVIRDEYPHIPVHQVPGNCDLHRMVHVAPETICYSICGVKLLMTHGHNHYVKSGVYHLYEDAKVMGAKAALFGHTHTPYRENREGIWLFNPGSCGNGGGTVGVIETENGEILDCKILKAEDWEENL